LVALYLGGVHILQFCYWDLWSTCCCYFYQYVYVCKNKNTKSESCRHCYIFL